MLIIDDDFSFVTELNIQLEKMGLKDIDSAESADTAFSKISEQKPEFVICDINLNGVNSGLELSEYFAKESIPFIIVTQYKDDDLYDHIIRFQPIAYFIKPIDYVAMKYTIKNLSKDRIIVPSKGDLHSDTYGDYVFIRKKSKYVRVNYSEVEYIQADGNYITFFCGSDKYIVRSSLRKCRERISNKTFIQVHRNYMVNKEHIVSYDSDSNLVMIDSKPIPVGRSFKSALKKELPLL